MSIEELKDNKDFNIVEQDKNDFYSLVISYKKNIIFNKGKIMCPHEDHFLVKKIMLEEFRQVLIKLNINF